jgi:putative cardiolipin synthase
MKHNGIMTYLSGLLLFISLFAGGCATVSLDVPKIFSTALPASDETRLGAALKPICEKHPGQSGFYLMPSGMEAFLARAFLIEAAGRSLDLQYYDFRDDTTSTLLLERILAAADRGVKVRFLLDDWNITGRDLYLDLLGMHHNIEVRVFNPFGGRRSSSIPRLVQYAFGEKRLKKRMHNKSFVVDNTMAVVGGRNIGDEYFNAKSDVNFSDLDILVAGPVVPQISVAFDEYWNSEYAVPIKEVASIEPNKEDAEEGRRLLEANKKRFYESEYAKRLRDSDFLKRLLEGTLGAVWTKGEYIYDKPGKIGFSIKDEPSAYMIKRLVDIGSKARTETLMISPYFVPGKIGMDWMKSDRERGVSVKVLTNSLASNDMKAAHGGYMNYREDMLRLGVHIYEMKPTSDEILSKGHRRRRLGSSSQQGALHAKTYVWDRQRAFVGSINFDPRSALMDTQDGMYMEGPEIAGQVARLFDEGISADAAFEVTLESGSQEADGSPPSEGRLTWISHEDGKDIRYYHEPMTSLWQRMKVRVVSWFTPEDML